MEGQTFTKTTAKIVAGLLLLTSGFLVGSTDIFSRFPRFPLRHYPLWSDSPRLQVLEVAGPRGLQPAVPEPPQPAVSEATQPSVSEVAQPGAAAASLPPGFDWEAYKFFNPELPIHSGSEAEAHYLHAGRTEGRLYKKVPLIISYDAKLGLCNQLLTHLMLLAISFSMNATLVLPVAWSRDSFDGKNYFRVQPLDTLLDVDRIITYWGQRGLEILQEPPDTASCMLVELPKNAGKVVRKPIQEAVSAIAAMIGSSGRGALQDHPDGDICVHVKYGSPYLTMSLDLKSSLPAVTEAARGLIFAPEVVQTADAIVQAMAASKHSPFLGGHLRIEGDWQLIFFRNRGWKAEDALGMYIETMRAANFTATSSLYVASGIFSYQTEQEIAETIRQLQEAGVCGSFLYKQIILPPRVLAGFHSEQLALIDLLVIIHAEAVVGDLTSSFSGFIRELRALQGIPRDTFHSVVRDRELYVFVW